MNAELRTIAPEMQMAVVRGTTTLADYRGFVRDFFAEGRWIRTVTHQVKEEKLFGDGPDPDALRLLALTGVEAAQYGFPRLDATLGRHRRHEWQKSAVSLQHQTAVLLYCATGAVASAETKEEFIAGEPSLDPVIWGVHLPIKAGDVTTDPQHLEHVRHRARALRSEPHRIIFLPNKPLKEALAELPEKLGGFNGDVADKMPDETFHAEVFPVIKKAVNGTVEIPIFQSA